jgi:glycoprotein 6-alpha-L-fucosyltransferase
MYNLSISDQLGEWRTKESLKLAATVQKRIDELQNPKKCSDSKKIICHFNKQCGYGCQMHHAMYCFVTAFFLDRTLILNSGGWTYDAHGIEAYFKPLSNSCLSTSPGENSVDWQSK